MGLSKCQFGPKLEDMAGKTKCCSSSGFAMEFCTLHFTFCTSHSGSAAGHFPENLLLSCRLISNRQSTRVAAQSQHSSAPTSSKPEPGVMQESWGLCRRAGSKGSIAAPGFVSGSTQTSHSLSPVLQIEGNSSARIDIAGRCQCGSAAIPAAAPRNCLHVCTQLEC